VIDIAKEYRVALPAWIDDELADVPATAPSREDRMRLVHRLADRNWREGNGGPFAALVAERESGRIVSVGVNVVLSTGVSSAHAEVVALGLAQTATGSWDLIASGLRDRLHQPHRAHLYPRSAELVQHATEYGAPTA